MHIDISAEDAQVLQNAINSQLHKLKTKRSALGTDYHMGRTGREKYLSGRDKLTQKIEHLQDISSSLEPVKHSENESGEDLFAGFEMMVISVWEDEGGSCLS